MSKEENLNFSVRKEMSEKFSHTFSASKISNHVESPGDGELPQVVTVPQGVGIPKNRNNRIKGRFPVPSPGLPIREVHSAKHVVQGLFG